MNLRGTAFLLVLCALPLTTARAVAPSFDCAKVEPASIEHLICQTPDLAELDQQMAAVYKQASAKTTNEHPLLLKADQRGWIKGRSECLKVQDRRRCLQDGYRLRIAELQARYALIKGTGPVSYQCDGQPAKQVVATYYPSKPPTAVVEFSDSTSVLFLEQTASGSKYVGRNESLWEHQGEATVTWGYGAPEMKCKARRTGR